MHIRMNTSKTEQTGERRKYRGNRNEDPYREEEEQRSRRKKNAEVEKGRGKTKDMDRGEHNNNRKCNTEHKVIVTKYDEDHFKDYIEDYYEENQDYAGTHTTWQTRKGNSTERETREGKEKGLDRREKIGREEDKPERQVREKSSVRSKDKTKQTSNRGEMDFLQMGRKHNIWKEEMRAKEIKIQELEKEIRKLKERRQGDHRQ